MKKYIFLLFIFCLQLAPAKAQWVTIPDANFVNFLTQNYPSCMNGNLMDTTCAQIINEDTVSVFGLGIANLTGIDFFTNLVSLNCSNNSLISLFSLPLTLANLNCSGNTLSNLLYLPSSLIKLDCSFNQLTNLPNLPITLQNLNCSVNDLTSLPSLPNSLQNLNCSVNDLTSLPSLPNSLKVLDCSVNYSFANLPQLPSSLLYLNYSDNFMNFQPQLPDSLQELDCSGNQLTSLPNLPSTLLKLYCDHNTLTQLPPLPGTLNYLDCGENILTSLPPLPNTLNLLYASNNHLTSVPYVPDTMGGFYVADNNIYCLANLPLVNSGTISNNPLTCVPNQTFYSLGLPLCLDSDPVNNTNNCISSVNISGKIYTDLNANCNYEISDLNSSNIPVKIFDSSNNLVAQNNAINGIYGFSINQTGTYTVKLPANSYIPFFVSCAQADSQIVNLVSTNTGISNINFPVQCSINNAFDTYSQSVITQGLVFPGQLHILNTNNSSNQTWYNLDCDSTNYTGTVTISITGPVTYVAPANNALTPTVNGNTFTYNITDFNTLTPQSFGLQFLTDTTTQANDQICVHVEIDPTPLDADTTNNVYDFCYQVVNSYDPNMKEVYPINVLPGYDDWFTYTIHFQNIGNAPAFNIRLRDTLDANLDINTFEVRGYSHPANVSINGNILTVRFNNIMLPDSTSNYEGSMGYFQYRIKPLPNLPLGTQIENTAYIYFDYNAPIVTNTTQNNFDNTLKTINLLPQTSQLSLFPNPSNGIFTFNESKNIKTVEVFNMMGELILSQGNTKHINLQAFPKGIYVARINGTFVARLVKE